MAEPHITNSIPPLYSATLRSAAMTVQPLAGPERSIAIGAGIGMTIPWYKPPTPAVTENQTPVDEMPAAEIAVRLENCRLEQANRDLMQMIAEADAQRAEFRTTYPCTAATVHDPGYGEQGDEHPMAPYYVLNAMTVEQIQDYIAAREEPKGKGGIPAQALRGHAMRIGLFTPR